MKIRVERQRRLRFYYPDASIVGEPNEGDSPYQVRPVVIFEVLSKSTRRTDKGEKLEDYLSLASLAVYALVEQNSAKVVVYRRVKKKFQVETYEGLDAVISLPEVDLQLTLEQVYQRIKFYPEQSADE